MTVTEIEPVLNDGSAVVKSYKVLKRLVVENGEVRLPGDYVPEALKWKNPDVWIRSHHIEMCYISEKQLAAWRTEYDERIKRYQEEASRLLKEAEDASKVAEEETQEGIDPEVEYKAEKIENLGPAVTPEPEKESAEPEKEQQQRKIVIKKGSE